MGKARILVDGAAGAISPRDWDYEGYTKHLVKIRPGYGMKQAAKLAKLTGASITVVPGFEAYTPVERQSIFTEGRALTGEQIESGDFEVAVVEWPDRIAGKSRRTFNRIAVGE